ncbi:MAG: hypothetical protein IIC18_05290 [Bacteroidetes bacterium]|nr:hypothetical protein [Bacteroidota bacterium]
MSKTHHVLRLHVEKQNPKFPREDRSVIYIDRPFIQERLGKQFALTPECTLPDLEEWVDGLINDLEEIKRQAHLRMDK